MIEILHCPVCGSNDFTRLTTSKDFTTSHETFHVKRCNRCTLGITSPRPDDAKLERYYVSDEYISHSGKSSGIGKIYQLARSFTLKSKRALIQKKIKAGSILDVGCGTGEFLKTMKAAGWKINGVEPSEIGRKKAQIITGTEINSSLSELTHKQFDVITLWHVFEHVSDLTEMLNQLKAILKKNGTIIIAVPNHESFDAKKYNAFWAGFDVPRHIWHFTRKSLEVLTKNTGLRIIQIRPMVLDAFYISMLSEKYKNNNTLGISQFLKGCFIGLVSNFIAMKTKNYSSLIYIISPQ